jgi:hypothetical protein
MTIKRFFDFIARWRSNPLYILGYAYYFFQDNFKAGVRFYTDEEFVEEMKKGRSFLRLLDGETHIMNGGSLAYQKYDRKMANAFKKIVSEYSDDAPYVIGIAKIYLNKTNKELKKENMFHVWLPQKVTYKLRFPKNAQYGDGHAFYRDGFFVKNMENILLDKHLLVVTNANSIESFKNNKNIPFKKFSFVETPSTHSYSKYDEIVENTKQALTKIPKEEKPVIIFSTGPASKQLVYEFSKLGYSCYDLGKGFEVLYSDTSIQYAI